MAVSFTLRDGKIVCVCAHTLHFASKDWKKNVGRVKLLQPTTTSVKKDTKIDEPRKSSSSVDRNEISKNVSEALRMARAKSMWDGSLQEFESDQELPEDLSESEKERDKVPSVSSKNDQEMMKEIRKINRNDIGCISQVGSLTMFHLFHVP